MTRRFYVQVMDIGGTAFLIAVFDTKAEAKAACDAMNKALTCCEDTVLSEFTEDGISYSWYDEYGFPTVLEGPGRLPQ